MLIGNEYCQEALSKDGEQQNESHMSKYKNSMNPLLNRQLRGSHT